MLRAQNLATGPGNEPITAVDTIAPRGGLSSVVSHL